MTRDEQIKKQADIYTDDASNYTEYSDDGGWSDTNDIELVEKAFIEGAKWADANPKRTWISVEDDLPCNHEELIITGNYYKKETINVITIDKHEIIDNYMVLCDGGKWEWKYGVKPYYWMPIPELPKE